MKVRDKTAWSDLRSVACLHDDEYISTEPYIEWDYELRIQMIGSDIKAFKKTNIDPAQWKSNCGGSVLRRCDLEEHHVLWITEASKMFGGLEILSLDVLHCVLDDSFHILEVRPLSDLVELTAVGRR